LTISGANRLCARRKGTIARPTVNFRSFERRLLLVGIWPVADGISALLAQKNDDWFERTSRTRRLPKHNRVRTGRADRRQRSHRGCVRRVDIHLRLDGRLSPASGQLRGTSVFRGRSVIGCQRSTYRATRLRGKRRHMFSFVQGRTLRIQLLLGLRRRRETGRNRRRFGSACRSRGRIDGPAPDDRGRRIAQVVARSWHCGLTHCVRTRAGSVRRRRRSGVVCVPVTAR
jgi:hypothetical protein